MKSVNNQTLIPQASYAKFLRPLLPSEAFDPDPNKLLILGINLAILMLGWAIAAKLDQWNPVFLGLYLPLAIIMCNSVTVLLFRGCLRSRS